MKKYVLTAIISLGLCVNFLPKVLATNISEDYKISFIDRDGITVVKNQYTSHQFNISITHNLPTILVDKDKFQQVMLNLIENAAKYSFDNSQIDILATCKDANVVSIKISDIGIGIDKDDYENIFKKFSRIDNPLTRKVQGSGLGLYITKNIVDKMNVTITVTAKELIEKNFKTTFEVCFPVCDIETQAREKCKQ